MKLDARRAAAFFRDPGPVRVVLLHGDDEGLVRLRADQLTKSVAGAADDPFRIAWLDRSDHDRLLEEASAIAMIGGRRVIRVREATDTLTLSVERILASLGDSLVILETAALTKRSKLLAAIEAAKTGAALACYPEEGDALRASIAAGLAAAQIRPDPDALDWLRDHLGGDHASTKGEIEKLILYAGPAGHLDLDAVRTCVGDQAATSIDDAVYATTLGNVEQADRATERAFAEGISPIALLRGLLAHLVRMHQICGRTETGASITEAVDTIRPPIFWKRKTDLNRSLQQWPAHRLTGAIAELRRVELACKQTGAPDQVMVRRLILTLTKASAPSIARRPG